jgi:hypothetical protein
MRRWVVVIAVVLGAVVVAPGTAGAAVRHVDGAMSGAGHFDSQSGCAGIIEQTGSGAFAARDLGVGTYTFSVCITQGPSALSFAGTASFRTHSGAQLHGTIDNSGPLGQYPTFVLTVTGGTRRYRHATGTLTLGPLAESNSTSCDPRSGVCLDWTDRGPLTGALRHVRPRR